MEGRSDWRPPPDSGGHMLVKLNIALIVISSVVMFTRLNVRAFMLRALWLDDLVATIGYALVITMSAWEIQTVQHGSGTHIDQIPFDELVKFYSSLVTLQLIFFPTLAVVRFSVMAFYLRLSYEKWFRWALALVAFVNLAITLVAFLYILTECKHIGDLWDITAPDRECTPKSQEKPVYWTHGIIGVAIDLSLLILPLWIIVSTMKFSMRMIQVVLVFGVGIFAIVAGIVRIYYSIAVNFLEETTYRMLLSGPWTDLEIHIGLWVACFPVLQPLLRYLGQKMGIGGSTETPEKKPSNFRTLSSQEATRKYSDWSGTSRASRASRVSRASHASRGTQRYLSFSDGSVDFGNRSVTCKRGSKATIENDELELLRLQGVPGIRKTTTVSIQVEETSGGSETNPESHNLAAELTHR